MLGREYTGWRGFDTFFNLLGITNSGSCLSLSLSQPSVSLWVERWREREFGESIALELHSCNCNFFIICENGFFPLFLSSSSSSDRVWEEKRRQRAGQFVCEDDKSVSPRGRAAFSSPDLLGESRNDCFYFYLFIYLFYLLITLREEKFQPLKLHFHSIYFIMES